MPCDPLVEPEFRKDPERQREPPLLVLPLLVRVVKGRRSWECRGGGSSLLLVQAWFVRRRRIRGLPVVTIARVAGDGSGGIRC